MQSTEASLRKIWETVNPNLKGLLQNVQKCTRACFEGVRKEIGDQQNMIQSLENENKRLSEDLLSMKKHHETNEVLINEIR